MGEAEFGVVLILVVAVAPMALWRWRFLHAERLKTDRYTLFAARDRWIRLVAESHLSEDDELFQFLYKEINDIIPKVKPLTLRNLVKALSESRIIKDTEFTKKCLALLEHQDKEVRAAAHEFFAALMNILLGRSKFVRISVSVARVTHSSIRALSFIRRALSRVFRTESEAYRIHKQLREMCPA